jgi:hypothetical protein
MHTLILPVPESSTLSLAATGIVLILCGLYARRLHRKRYLRQTVKEVLANAPSVSAQLLAARAAECDGRMPRRRDHRMHDPLTIDEVMGGRHDD